MPPNGYITAMLLCPVKHLGNASTAFIWTQLTLKMVSASGRCGNTTPSVTKVTPLLNSSSMQISACCQQNQGNMIGSISCIWWHHYSCQISNHFKQHQGHAISAKIVIISQLSTWPWYKKKYWNETLRKGCPIRLCVVISIYGRCRSRLTIGIVSSMIYIYMGTKTLICTQQYIYIYPFYSC